MVIWKHKIFAIPNLYCFYSFQKSKNQNSEENG